MNGIFFNQGHVCCAGSRLLVQESIADRLLDKLKRRLGTLRLGDPLDKNTDIGAINSRDQLEKIKRSSEWGSMRGPSSTSPRATSPTAASGSRRRSSPASLRAIASRRRRSSDPSCR